GIDEDAGALNRNVDGGDHTAALRIERADGAGEDREPHRADELHVADEAVGDAARRLTGARGGREQFAPRRHHVAGRTGEHRDVAGLEAVDEGDFQLVRIALGDV